MKQLFKKPNMVGMIVLSLMLFVFVLNAWVLSLKFLQPYDEDNFFRLANQINDGGSLVIFSFIVVLLFYVTLVPLLLSTISVIRKSQWAMLPSTFYLLAITSTLIIFQAIEGVLSVFALVLLSIGLVVILSTMFLVILRNRLLSKNKVPHKAISKAILTSVLVIDVLSLVVFMTTFFVPVYSLLDISPDYHAVLIGALFGGDTNFEVIGYFLLNFTILLGLFLFLSDVISHFFFDQEKFIKKSMAFINYIFVFTLVFFIAGLGANIYYTLKGNTSMTLSFIPISMMVFVIFAFAVLKGKYHIDHPIEYKDLKIKYAKSEPLLYVFLLTLVTLSLLFIPILVMNVTFGSFDYAVDLTGLKILTDYPNLDPGYRLVAYLLVVMLLSSGLSLVLTISSYLSNFKQFNAIVKFASIVNLFFVFVIAISGYYFQIAQEINRAVMMDMFDFYGITLPSDIEYTYAVGTNAIYVLFVTLLVLILMFARKAFDRTDFTVLAAQMLPNNDIDESKDEDKTETPSPKDNILEDVLPFDPCPAFTNLDLKVDTYKSDLEQRQAVKTQHKTLNELVNFVVDYAKNSRLHLSYTPEDIATFVAGLGASKLSILQGMSGTGKTSLPKIFSEAIFGNCEIIEVESSWKDKNELLGYYNEFSMKYTPKKFTLALYKAALNPEIFTFILLDEMNLSRIEYYFSDFLSLMENEVNQRQIKLLNINLKRQSDEGLTDYLALEEGNTLAVPKNVWFIGTANRDESTFVISDKVYDRATTMNFTKRAPKVRNYSDPMPKQYYDYEAMNQLFEAAKKQGNFDAENSPLIKAVETLLAPFNISFGNRILKQIEDFVNIYKACFSNEDVEAEAIEKILLSKVVAKLETKTIDDKEKLEEAFLKLKLNQCAAFVNRLDND